MPNKVSQQLAETKDLWVMFKDSIVQFLGVVLTFLAPAAFIILAVGAFIALDTIIGWYKHKATPSGANSKGLRKGFASKSIIYSLVVITFYLVDYAITNEVLKTVIPFEFLLTKGVALVLIWIELISINENFREIKGISLAEAFRRLLRGLSTAKKGINEIRKDEK